MALHLEKEKDIEQLRRLAIILDAQMNHLLKVVVAQSRQLEKLTGRDVLQPVLVELEKTKGPAKDAEPTDPADRDKQKTRRKPEQPGHGPTQQPRLERVSRLYEDDVADRICPQCGDELKAFVGQFETSEMIDVVNVRYELVEVQRQKYVCGCGGCVETALGPERAIDGGRYSLEFAIKVAIDKYLHHLPLERQVRMMGEAGLEVTSQTLWDMIWTLGLLAEPTYRAIYDHVLSQPIIGLDQTGWPSLHSKKARKWQMWCLTADGVVFHQIRDDKGAKTFGDLVGDFEGYIVCDDLSTHSAGARAGPGITLAGCWAHIRRKFADAEPNHPEARTMLNMIKELYEIDAKATSSEERARLRDTESREVLKRMLKWLHAQRAPKTTSIGNAVRHTVSIWPRLKEFAGTPDVWLDNNATERAFRGPVVGRRNHYGSKSRRGTRAAAILYTLIETAKASGVSPTEYLGDVMRAAKRDKSAVTLPLKLVSEPTA